MWDESEKEWKELDGRWERVSTDDNWAIIDPNAVVAAWTTEKNILYRWTMEDFAGQVKKLLVLKGGGVDKKKYQRPLSKAHFGEFGCEEVRDEIISSAVIVKAGTGENELVLVPVVRGTYPISVLSPTFTGPEVWLTGAVEQMSWVTWGWKFDPKSQAMVGLTRVRGLVDVVWSEKSRKDYGKVISIISSSMVSAYRRDYKEMSNPLPGGAPGLGRKELSGGT